MDQRHVRCKDCEGMGSQLRHSRGWRLAAKKAFRVQLQLWHTEIVTGHPAVQAFEIIHLSHLQMNKNMKHPCSKHIPSGWWTGTFMPVKTLTVNLAVHRLWPGGDRSSHLCTFQLRSKPPWANLLYCPAAAAPLQKRSILGNVNIQFYSIILSNANSNYE